MSKEKILGFVSEREKNRLIIFHERRIALNELALSLQNNFFSNKEKVEIIKKIEMDEKEVLENIDNWWKEKAEKYEWEGYANSRWEINFDTNEIILKII